MCALSWFRESGIKRYFILIISIAMISTIILAIIFAILNTEVTLNDDGDDDDGCEII
ncbi:MAG: hypothetical protein ACXABO_08595 [Promethearchaeota archaeon]|jgi:hypothetical protein